MQSTTSEQVKSCFSPFNLLQIPKSDFHYESCKLLLVNSVFSSNETLAYTALDFTNNQQISCCGALVKFLQGSSLTVSRINYSNSSNLSIDFSTLTSLQIVQEDSHPSNVKNVGKAKEGISIMALIDNTSTPQGKRRLKEIVLRPFKRQEEIEERLETLAFFIENFSVSCEAIKLIKFCRDLEVGLKRMKEGKSTSGDWKKLFNTIKAFVEIQKRFKGFDLVPQVLLRVFEVNLASLEKIQNLLEHFVDFSFNLPSIRKGVSEELDYFNKVNEEVEEIKSQIIKSEKIRLAPTKFSKITLIYVQGLGNLIELFYDNGAFPETFDPDYSFQFATDNCLYFKTPKTVALDEKFGDIRSKSKDIENSLLTQIESEILNYTETLKEVSEIIAELDALFCLVLFAENYRLTRPVILSQAQIQVVNGRHLLVEICNDSCIPNDCALDQSHRIGLITGPNYSGKSIYIKMIGIIVYLAHIGCYVPAEVAEIGVLEHIFSRIHSEETKIFSSFSKELMQVSIALNNSSERSLFIFDEFGKGTSAADGSSILVALIEDIESNPNISALFTTHYHEITKNGLIRENECIQFYTMEVTHMEKLVFLYKLIKGASFSSYGLYCAELAGLPAEIIDRSREIQRLLENPEDLNNVSKENEERLAAIWNYMKELNENDANLAEEIVGLLKHVY